METNRVTKFDQAKPGSFTADEKFLGSFKAFTQLNRHSPRFFRETPLGIKLNQVHFRALQVVANRIDLQSPEKFQERRLAYFKAFMESGRELKIPALNTPFQPELCETGSIYENMNLILECYNEVRHKRNKSEVVSQNKNILQSRMYSMQKQCTLALLYLGSDWQINTMHNYQGAYIPFPTSQLMEPTADQKSTTVRIVRATMADLTGEGHVQSQLVTDPKTGETKKIFKTDARSHLHLEANCLTEFHPVPAFKVNLHLYLTPSTFQLTKNKSITI